MIKWFLILSIMLVLIALIYMNCDNIEPFSTDTVEIDKIINKLSLRILIYIINKSKLTEKLLIEAAVSNNTDEDKLNKHRDELYKHIEDIEDIKSKIYEKLPEKLRTLIDDSIELNTKHNELNIQLTEELSSISDEKIKADLKEIIPKFNILKKMSIDIKNIMK